MCQDIKVLLKTSRFLALGSLEVTFLWVTPGPLYVMKTFSGWPLQAFELENPK